MPKLTLLDVVQSVLSDMNSDNVNSISDTIEAQQAANIAKRVYFNMHNERVWPHRGQLFRLSSSTDNARPTHMKMEEDVISVEWVRYESRTDTTKPLDYLLVEYKTPDEFLTLVHSRDPSKDNVQTVIDFHGTPLFVLNDHAPTCYTSFDDEYLVFDSYDMTMDSILQHSKTQVFGYVEPDWLTSDTFIPEMPAKVFPYYLAEVTSECFLKIKEVFSQKDEQNSNRQKSWLSREKHRVDGATKYPNYGKPSPRRSRGGYKNNQFTG